MGGLGVGWSMKSIFNELRHWLCTVWAVEVLFELGEEFQKLHLELRPLGSESLNAL